ncbi:hypothetical protein UR09_00085 [Candidatus Nitromaritima sp. SCGC AAA799-A02]|nr:hypothetical protein UR09_00085 [Candidatus Nitromaritima sp. SCGC AAA799-A02]
MPSNKIKLILFALIAYLLLGSSSNPAQSRTTTDVGEGEYLDLTPETYKLQVNVELKDEQTLFPAYLNFQQKQPSVPTEDMSGWKSQEDAFLWNPEANQPVLNIPLVPESNVNTVSKQDISMLYIDYEDLSPENPSQVSLIFSKDKTSNTVKTGKSDDVEPGDEKSADEDFDLVWEIGSKEEVEIDSTEVELKEEVEIDSTEVELLENEALLQIQKRLTPLHTMEVRKAIWKKKNTLYLARRALGMSFDPDWRYAQDRQYTVFQRRLHRNLSSFETMDLSFDPKVTKGEMGQVVCNFRISFEDPAGSLIVLPTELLPTRIMRSSSGHPVLRIELGDYIRSLYSIKKVPFLEEIIVFFPGEASHVAQAKPLQKIVFHKLETKKPRYLFNSINVASASWVAKSRWYLIQRELGLPGDEVWRFSQDRENAVFKRRLHQNLHHIDRMEIRFNFKPKTMFYDCRIRIGFSDWARPSETIWCGRLRRQSKTIDGRPVITVQLNDLVRKYYSKGKDKVFLEEITIYLPGDAEDYIQNNLLQSVNFYSPYKIKKNIDPAPSASAINKLKSSPYKIKKNIDPAQTRMDSFFTFLTQQVELEKGGRENQLTLARTFIISRHRKRFALPMADLNQFLGSGEYKVTLSIQPQDPLNRAGFRLLGAKGLFSYQKITPTFLKKEIEMNRQWGGPFLKPSGDNLFEGIKVAAYQPFKFMDNASPYQSGKVARSSVKVEADQDLVYRVSNSAEGIALDMMFFSAQSQMKLGLPSIGPFPEDREISMEWDIEGPLAVYLDKSKYSLPNAKKVKFTLKKGTTPNFRIRMRAGSTLDTDHGTRARLVIKKATIKGQWVLRLGIAQVIKYLRTTQKSDDIFLKGLQFSFPGNLGKTIEKPFVTKIQLIHPKAQTSSPSQSSHNGEPFGVRLKPMDFLYKMKRYLGLPPDTLWRYSQGPFFNFKRRFHEDLATVKAIDFVFLPDTRLIKTKTCHLKIGFNKTWPRAQKTIACRTLPRKWLETNGRQVLRIDVGKTLRLFADRENIFLEEISLDIHNESGRPVEAWPLEKIIYMTSDGDGPLRPIKTLHLFDNQWWRPKNPDKNSPNPGKAPENPVRVLELSDALWEELSFSDRVKNYFTPLTGDTWRYWQHEDYTTFQRQTNEVITSTDRIDVYLQGERHSNFNQSIKCALTFGFSESGQTSDTAYCKNLPSQMIRKPDTIVNFKTPSAPQVGKKIKPALQEGIKIQGDAPFTSRHQGSKGLVLKGKGDWIEIDWPVQTSFSKDTRFYLKIPQGARSMVSLQLFPFSEGQALAPIAGFPNEPLRINYSAIHVDHLKVRLLLHEGKPFKMVFQEMALFEPSLLTLGQALPSESLFREKTLLVPKNFSGMGIKTITTKPGYMKIDMLPEPGDSSALEWTTEVNRNINWLQGVKIRYSLPNATLFPSTCWIKLILVTSRQQIEQPFCPNGTKGQALIPLGNNAADHTWSHGEILETIHWTADFRDPTDSQHSRTPFNFEIEMELDGFTVTPLQQQIAVDPIFKLENHIFYPTSISMISPDLLVSGNAWLEMGDVALKDKRELDRSLIYLDHPYLKTKTLSLGNKDFKRVATKSNFQDAPGIPQRSVWISIIKKLLLFSIFPTLVYFAMRKGWIQTIYDKLLPWARQCIYLAINSFQYLSTKKFEIGYSILIALFSIIVLALIWVDYISFSDPKILAAVILLTGILWRETCPLIQQNDYLSQKHPVIASVFKIGEERIPSSIHYLTGLVLSTTALLLGSGKPEQNLGWILLAVAAPAYFYHPWLYRTKELLLLFKKSFTPWLVLSGSIYFLGCLALLGGMHINNLWIICNLGGFILAIAWHCHALLSKPWFDKQWPRVSSIIFSGKDKWDIAGFLILLVPTTFFRLISLELIAEQFAIVAFYLLIMGSAYKLWSFNLSKKSGQNEGALLLSQRKVMDA